MCLPVMRALRKADPGCDVHILALTTAFAVAQRAGESPWGYKDFTNGPEDARALAYGQQLLTGHDHPQVTAEESMAYLGFNFLEWVDAEGEERAWERWRAAGRQGFLPVHFFVRILRQLSPDVLVTTNSPRSEQAAIEAACKLGIPSLSMVDLFAFPGDPYLQRNVHASRITVLSDVTRANLLASGIEAQRVVVTGNPAMDAIASPASIEAGKRWRAARGWMPDAKVVLWAGHKETDDALPASWAGCALGGLVQQRLLQWVAEDALAHLAIRYHPNEWHEFSPPPLHPRIHWSQPDAEPLLPVLMGSDVVVVQASTVGVQAHVAGKRLICLGFSPLVQRSGMDYGKLGLGASVDCLDALIHALQRDTLTTVTPQHRDRMPAAVSIAQHVLALARKGVCA